MNRQIKFRAWDVDNGKMVCYGNGDYREWCVRTDGKYGYVSRDGYLNTDSYNCSLMQYTGLKDKNGKEVYEGDVCKTQSVDFGQQIQKVVFDRGSFCFDYMGWAIGEYKFYEVIGNIYENPELLNHQP